MDKNIRETKASSNYMFSNSSQFCWAQNYILCEVVEIFLESSHVYNVTYTLRNIIEELEVVCFFLNENFT